MPAIAWFDFFLLLSFLLLSDWGSCISILYVILCLNTKYSFSSSFISRLLIISKSTKAFSLIESHVEKKYIKENHKYAFQKIHPSYTDHSLLMWNLASTHYLSSFKSKYPNLWWHLCMYLCMYFLVLLYFIYLCFISSLLYIFSVTV